MTTKTRHKRRTGKIFIGDMRRANKAAKQIKRLLPDVRRAGVTYFDFGIWGDGRRPCIVHQFLDDDEELVRIPKELGRRLLRAALQMMPPAWHKGAAADGELSCCLKQEVIRLEVTWKHEKNWPLTGEAKRRLSCDEFVGDDDADDDGKVADDDDAWTITLT